MRRAHCEWVICTVLCTVLISAWNIRHQLRHHESSLGMTASLLTTPLMLNSPKSNVMDSPCMDSYFLDCIYAPQSMIRPSGDTWPGPQAPSLTIETHSPLPPSKPSCGKSPRSGRTRSASRTPSDGRPGLLTTDISIEKAFVDALGRGRGTQKTTTRKRQKTNRPARLSQ